MSFLDEIKMTSSKCFHFFIFAEIMNGSNHMLPKNKSVCLWRMQKPISIFYNFFFYLSSYCQYYKNKLLFTIFLTELELLSFKRCKHVQLKCSHIFNFIAYPVHHLLLKRSFSSVCIVHLKKAVEWIGWNVVLTNKSSTMNKFKNDFPIFTNDVLICLCRANQSNHYTAIVFNCLTYLKENRNKFLKKQKKNIIMGSKIS